MARHFDTFAGMQLVPCPYLTEAAPRPPKNRRDARRRLIIARRRKRTGAPIPQYTRTIPSTKCFVVNRMIFGHPKTLAALTPDSFPFP